MSIEKLGLSHALSPESAIVHTTVMGSNCLGRITDLFSGWCKRELKIEENILSDFRLLIQALLEFSCPKQGEALGQIELAEDGQFLLVATRFPCRIAVTQEALSKDLTKFWLNSDEVKLLKRLLHPQDRVEVRYHVKMNLIEWRVCRPKGLHSVEMDPTASFRVFTDGSVGLDSVSNHYQELSDLPFDQWLSETYRNKRTGSRAGSVVIESGESQDQQEWARVVVDREKQDIEKELERIFKSEALDDEEVIRRFSQSSDSPESEATSARHRLQPAELESILSENKDLKDAATEISKRARKTELTLEREKIVYSQKIKSLEELLRKKEYINQRNTDELSELRKVNAEIKSKSTSSQAGGNDHFRAKALEMYEMLKQVKEEKRELERQLDSRNEIGVENRPIFNPKQVEELTKKLERNQRALETEKSKVKALSERVIVAEKEAQSSGPLIEDLESKIEFTLKTVQQHKKETEQVKQKLVQSDAEKNRIKNDLVKAQAQIQTLMKRQAS